MDLVSLSTVCDKGRVLRPRTSLGFMPLGTGVDFFAMPLWYGVWSLETITREDMPSFSAHQLTEKLLAWFAHQRRTLAWRDAPCGARDAYRVWLAEIMLQQTTVTAVTPYYLKFLDAWPDVKALAGATDDDVMRAWAGLGYYARARNLLKCARFVADECQGVFPSCEDDLLGLPGVGPYTAAAIAAIAFNHPAAPVDGNVIRTLSRLYAIDAEMPKHKGQVATRAQAMLPPGQSGDFAEALMDLGSQVCRPKNPDCPACPWQSACMAYAAGREVMYPIKAAKKAKPTRRGWAFWVERPDGHVLLERRAPKGLLGGMVGLPTTDWGDGASAARDAVAQLFTPHSWDAVPGLVTHTFTHFHLELGIIRVRLGEGSDPKGLWTDPDDVDNQALPSLMKKAVHHARTGADSQNAK